MSDVDPSEPMSPSPPRGSGQAYALFGGSLLLVLVIGSVAQVISFPVGLAITELMLILLPAALFVRWQRLPVTRGLGWTGVAPGTALLSVAVGVSGWGVAAGIAVLSIPLIGEGPSIGGMAPGSVPELLLLLVIAAVLPGLCEESLFRGAIQGVLRRHGPRKAVVIAAALFAVYHMNPWILVPAFFLGVIYGSLAVRTGSIVPSILAHAANNATAVTVGYAYREGQGEGPTPLLVMLVLAVAFCVLFPVLWRTAGARSAELPPLATVPARLTRPVAWIAGGLAGIAVAGVVAAVAAFFAMTDTYTMSKDAVPPMILQGDRVVVLRSGILPVGAGDIVAFRRDGTVVVRLTTKVEGDRVWVQDEGAEVELALSEIAGTVVHTIEIAPRE